MNSPLIIVSSAPRLSSDELTLHSYKLARHMTEKRRPGYSIHNSSNLLYMLKYYGIHIKDCKTTFSTISYFYILVIYLASDSLCCFLNICSSSFFSASLQNKYHRNVITQDIIFYDLLLLLLTVGLLHNSCAPMHAGTTCNKRVAILVV